jgi:hypothetical protein
MIGMDGAPYSVGMREWITERGLGRRSVSPCRGECFEPGLEEPAMSRIPAYDPLVIAWLGIGVLAVTALALMP